MSTRVRAIVWKVVQFPLTRIVIALVFVGGLNTLVQFQLDGVGRFLSTAILVLLADLTYRLYVRVIEGRTAGELGFRAAAVELLAGIGVGAALFTATVGLLWLAGSYRIAGINPWLAAAAALPASIRSGYVEEVVLRGVVFRITEEGLGSWFAVAISAGLFGLAHIGNPNATWVSTAAIALEAGVLLAAAYMVTRRLWLPIGIHFAWNFTQGGIFGIAVSGHQMNGLLRSELSGSPLISGGSFGAEASVFAVAVCLVAGVFLLLKAGRAGHFIRPFWRRAA